jgi:hypothetical protein
MIPLYRPRFRYLYLMQKGDSNVVKIGVSNTPWLRKHYIGQNVPNIRIIRCVRTNRAKFWEEKLHNKYASSRFVLRGGGSGRTEYFRLNWVEFALVLYDFWFIKVFPLSRLLEYGVALWFVYLLLKDAANG